MKKFSTLLVFTAAAIMAFADSFVKVTTTPADWTGEYLIVCEDANVAFDGSLSKLDAVSDNIEVAIDNGKIYATTKNLKSTFTLGNDGSILSASGKYIGRKTDANGMEESTTAFTNTLSIADGNFSVLSEGGAYLRYNAASGQERFRFYKSATYEKQKAIQLYKLEKNDDPIQEIKVDTVVVTPEEVEFYYYADDEADDFNYFFSFTDKELGWEFAFDLYAEKENVFEGKYTMTDETLGQEYTYAVYGDGENDYYASEDGEVIITKNANDYTVEGWVLLENEKLYKFTYTGELDPLDPNYAYEPKTVTTYSSVATDGGYVDYTEEYGDVYVYLENEDDGVLLDIFLSQTNPTTIIPVGEYPINATGNVNTVAASTGETMFGTMPSYLNTDYVQDEEGDWYAQKTFYLMSGTVKVSESSKGVKIEVDAVSYYGSTVKVTYEGTLENLADDTAVENLTQPLDLNQPMYNALGVEVGKDYKGVVIQNGKKYIVK